MQKIIPHLWYDKEAGEAAELYVSLFENSRINERIIIEGTPSGDAELILFELAGQEFQAISAGPIFQLNPSISFAVACSSANEVDHLYNSLKEGGTELMPLGEYPFSQRFVWIQDRYGLSWQLSYVEGKEASQKITPHLLFSNEASGRAESAIRYYTEAFKNAKIDVLQHDETNEKVSFTAFQLAGTKLTAADNTNKADFNFNESFSFILECEDQAEMDYFTEMLSYVPEAEACGWVKDQFGISWQIVPNNMGELLYSGTPEQNKRATEAMLKMKRLNILAIENAKFGQ